MKDSKINELKKNILETAHRIDEGHIASAFSILDILWVLYDRILYIDPKDLSSEHRDRFILSKGHASLGLYVVLAEKLFFDKEVLESFCIMVKNELRQQKLDGFSLDETDFEAVFKSAKKMLIPPIKR